MADNPITLPPPPPSDSPSSSAPSASSSTTSVSLIPPEFAIDFITEEEMAIIDAAIAAATRSAAAVRPAFSSPTSLSKLSSPSSSSSSSAPNFSFITTTTRQVRRSSGVSGSSVGDIEDIGLKEGKETELKKSLFARYRKPRSLSVTDIVAAEWCEKQMEFVLTRGKPEKTHAMKAGSSRHAELEEEVVKRVAVSIESREDSWALRLVNFICGTNQLLSEGLTRELPVMGLVEGVWVVGVIDELQMPMEETVKSPVLIDTKTRQQPTVPSEAQKRNARLQLMCYKHLWDSIVADVFPTSFFYKCFRLRHKHTFSKDVKESLTNMGIEAETLEELMGHFRNACSVLPSASKQLLLRYEFQGDHSLLSEDWFEFNADWFKETARCSLDFWMGKREAMYVSDCERWKCRFCTFASSCQFAQSR